MPLLRLLDHFRVKYMYDVTMGLWAGGAENTVDFRFDDDLIESNEYALIVGKWANLTHEDVTCIKGTQAFAAHLQSTSANCNTWWMPKCDADPWASGATTHRCQASQRETNLTKTKTRSRVPVLRDCVPSHG